MITGYKKPLQMVSKLSCDLIKAPHFFIVGATGAGKTTLFNAFLCDLLVYSPEEVETVLIDLKGMELWSWQTVHTRYYCDDVPSTSRALSDICDMIHDRAMYCRKHGLKKWPGKHTYIIIDEYADLMIKGRKETEKQLVDIAIMGRSSGVHLCIATQRPTKDTLTGAVSVNIDTRVCLKVATAQDSRNAISVSGAEELPLHGVGYLRSGAELQKVEIPYYSDERIAERLKHWQKQRWKRCFNRI